MIPKPATVALLGGIRATIFALLAALFLTGGIVQTFRLHYVEGRLDHYAKEAAKAEALRQFADKAAKDELDRLRNAAPKAGKTIREVVHDHPSDCIVPATDKLRDAIRQSNAARGVSGNA